MIRLLLGVGLGVGHRRQLVARVRRVAVCFFVCSARKLAPRDLDEVGAVGQAVERR